MGLAFKLRIAPTVHRRVMPLKLRPERFLQRSLKEWQDHLRRFFEMILRPALVRMRDP